MEPAFVLGHAYPNNFREAIRIEKAKLDAPLLDWLDQRINAPRRCSLRQAITEIEDEGDYDQRTIEGNEKRAEEDYQHPIFRGNVQTAAGLSVHRNQAQPLTN
jgi:hypothetical protein